MWQWKNYFYELNMPASRKPSLVYKLGRFAKQAFLCHRKSFLENARTPKEGRQCKPTEVVKPPYFIEKYLF